MQERLEFISAADWAALQPEAQKEQIASLKRFFTNKMKAVQDKEADALGHFTGLMRMVGRVRWATFVLTLSSAALSAWAATGSAQTFAFATFAATVTSTLATAGVATSLLQRKQANSDEEYVRHHKFKALYHEYDLKWHTFVEAQQNTHRAYVNAYELLLALTHDMATVSTTNYADIER